MSIKIAERFRPFTHVPGAKFILPGTNTTIQVYPTKVFVEGKEYTLTTQGVVDKFIAILDLEQGKVIVSGVASREFFRFAIDQKGPQDVKEVDSHTPPLERLFLGCTKQQNFEKIYQRCDLSEVLPLWFFAGQYAPEASIGKGKSLLQELEKFIQSKEIVAVKNKFKEIFKVSFSSLLYPEAEDIHHLGAPLPSLFKRS